MSIKIALFAVAGLCVCASFVYGSNFDLTDSDRNRRILESAQVLLENQGMLQSCPENATQADFWDQNLARKLAESKHILRSLNKNVHVTIVIPVYKEINRMMTREHHESGEDFVREKIRQLNWFSDCPKFTWNIVIVDDGCPFKSGALAQKIVNEFSIESKQKWPVSVEFLEDGISKKDASYTAISALSSANESKKGGAVYYGLSKAIASPRPANSEHIVLYTDADLSAHLGFVGFAVEQIVNQGFDVSIGSRKLELASTKGANTRGGKLWCYLWSSLFPDLKVTDTQVGFKAFRSQVLNQILSNPLIEFGLAFDVELLILANRLKPDSIGEFVMTWIDSVAESKVRNDQERAFFEMVRSLGNLYGKYGEKNDWSDSFAQLANSLSLEELDTVLKRCPKEIYFQSYLSLRDYKGVKADDLRALSR